MKGIEYTELDKAEKALNIDPSNIDNEYRVKLQQYFFKKRKKERWRNVLSAVLIVVVFLLGAFYSLKLHADGAGVTMKDVIALSSIKSNYYDQAKLKERMQVLLGERQIEFTSIDEDYGAYLAALVTNDLNTDTFYKYTAFNKVMPKYYEKYIEASNESKIANVTYQNTDDLCYLKFDKFVDDETIAIFQEHLDDLEAANTIVLDLTENVGGSIEEVRKILELFLNSGEEAFTKVTFDESGEKVERKVEAESDSVIHDKTIYIVTNQNTASGAEIMTLSLKKSSTNVTKIIGEETYAKTLGFYWLPLHDGGYVNIAHFDTFINGRSATANPIYPDHYVIFPDNPTKTDAPDYELRRQIHLESVLDYVRMHLMD